MDSTSLCSLAGQYDNPIPTRSLAPVDCLKIPALFCMYDDVCFMNFPNFVYTYRHLINKKSVLLVHTSTVYVEL